MKVEFFFRGETVWLTQKAIAELFGVKVPAINKPLKNSFESGELTREATVSKMEIVRPEGARAVAREVEFYNLDTIIDVGYRVNSYQATQFRIWATKTLREFITKGFVMDDERLKRGKQVFGKDYFEELLERIREIRASERRFYQKLTDIYALAVDDNADAPRTKEFFATVQNKLHWAITGQTAAELIYASADATKLDMGLATWTSNNVPYFPGGWSYAASSADGTKLGAGVADVVPGHRGIAAWRSLRGAAAARSGAVCGSEQGGRSPGVGSRDRRGEGVAGRTGGFPGRLCALPAAAGEADSGQPATRRIRLNPAGSNRIKLNQTS